MKRKIVFLIILLSVFTFTMVFNSSNIGAADVDSFPERDITLIIGYGAGGGTDLIGRQLAKNAEKFVDVNVNVVNITGGASVPSMTDLLSKKPDGYIVQLTTPVFCQYHHISEDIDWSYEDFTRIMNVGSDPFVISVNPELPWEDIDDLVEDAKNNPGKYSGAIVAPGVIWGDSLIAFVESVGIYDEVKIIPNPLGTAGCLQSVVGGHTDFLAVSAGEVFDHVKAGKLNLIGVSGDERNPNFPEVPTLNEQGYDVYPVSNFRGLIAPPGMDEAIKQKLHDIFKKAMEEQEFIDFMNGRGMQILYLSGDEYDNFLEEQDEWFGNFYENSQFYQDRAEE